MSDDKVVEVHEPSKTLQEDGEQIRRRVDTQEATDVISAEGHVSRHSKIGKDLEHARLRLDPSELARKSFDARMKYVYNLLSKINKIDRMKHHGPMSDELAYSTATKQRNGVTAGEMAHALDIIKTFTDEEWEEVYSSSITDGEHVIIAEDFLPKTDNSDVLLASGKHTHARALMDSMPSSNSGDYLGTDTFEQKLNYVYNVLRTIEKENVKREKNIKAAKSHPTPYDEYAAYDAIYYDKKYNTPNIYVPSLGSRL